MAMRLKDNKLYVYIPSSESMKDNQISISINRDADVCGYYTSDIDREYEEIRAFFGDCSLDVIVDSKKTNKFFQNVKKRIYNRNRSLFKGNMDNFIDDASKFIRSDVKIDHFFFGGANERYLKLNRSDVLTKSFVGILLGDVTTVVIEKSTSNFKVYPVFRPLFTKREDFEGEEPLVCYLSEEAESYGVLTDEELSDVKSGYIFDLLDYNKGAVNEIYYGVPGCGKSYKVDEIYNDKENKVIRTVFHPEYSYSDFVGQIVPLLTTVKDGDVDVKKISYEFKNGPFVEALIEAYKNKDRKVVLIIEEINRGNAAAIFGEIFQLLDRDENCASKYFINNDQITQALDKVLRPATSFSEIRIPGNLFVIATMNTSDQNVFTLDTAFKRRWDMKRISNNFNGDYGSDLGKMYVPGSEITWKDFVDRINNYIVNNNRTGLYSEDKQIGAYFVGKNYLCEKENENNEAIAKRFANKVLMYIWEDIARLNVSSWFDEINSLEELFDKFEKYAKDATKDSLEVFKDIFKKIDETGA